MNKLQDIFFEIVDKEEALRLFDEGKTELYFLHDDLGESLVENKDELLDTQEQIGKERTPEDTETRKYEAFTEIYSKLNLVKDCLRDSAEDKDKTHYDCQSDLEECMTSLNYIESLGME